MTSGVFNNLPQEVSAYLLSFLDNKQLAPLSRVNSDWYATAIYIIRTRNAPLKMSVTNLVQRLDAEENKSQIAQLNFVVNDILGLNSLTKTKVKEVIDAEKEVIRILKDVESLAPDPLSVDNLWALSRIELNKDKVESTSNTEEKKDLIIKNFVDLSTLGYKTDALEYLNSIRKQHPGLFSDRIEMILESIAALYTVDEYAPMKQAMIENFVGLIQLGCQKEAFECLDRFELHNLGYLNRAEFFVGSSKHLYTQTGKLNLELLKCVNCFPFQETDHIISECHSLAAIATELKEDNFSKRVTLLAKIFEMAEALNKMKDAMDQGTPEDRAILQRKCRKKKAVVKEIVQEASQLGMTKMVAILQGKIDAIALVRIQKEMASRPQPRCTLF